MGVGSFVQCFQLIKCTEKNVKYKTVANYNPSCQKIFCIYHTLNTSLNKIYDFYIGKNMNLIKFARFFPFVFI